MPGAGEHRPGKRSAPLFGAVDATLRSLGEAAYWVVREDRSAAGNAADGHSSTGSYRQERSEASVAFIFLRSTIRSIIP